MSEKATPAESAVSFQSLVDDPPCDWRVVGFLGGGKSWWCHHCQRISAERNCPIKRASA